VGSENGVLYLSPAVQPGVGYSSVFFFLVSVPLGRACVLGGSVHARVCLFLLGTFTVALLYSAWEISWSIALFMSASCSIEFRSDVLRDATVRSIQLWRLGPLRWLAHEEIVWCHFLSIPIALRAFQMMKFMSIRCR
jgi:hypothetical protein